MNRVRAYLIPSPNRSDVEAQRWAQEDLQAMSDFRLWQEAERVKAALTWADSPDPWLKERFAAIEQEQRRRRATCR